jgi:hypothetical protein
VGVCVIVCEDLMGVGVFSDENGIQNPRELLEDI